MNKVFLQFLLLLFIFFAAWFLISRLNFMQIFRVEERISVNEKKLGDLIWDTYRENEKTVTDSTLNSSLESLKTKLCRSNNITPDSISLYIVKKDEVNAFALPGRRLVIFTGLIADCKNAEELAGVMAHEIAHIEKKHVMKKLIKEAGVAILISVTDNIAGIKIIKELIQSISSTAYDRSLEEEADETGAKYLCKVHADPENMASFFLRMAGKDKKPGVLDWISTHPDSKDRATAILKLRKELNCTYQPLLPQEDWDNIVAMVKTAIQ